MNNIISIRDAALTYQARNGEVEALRSVSFDVAEGEFVSIVEQGNFERAANLLYLSQSALSKHIQKMEREAKR